MAFVLKDCVRRISPNFIKEYCKKNNINFSINAQDQLEVSTAKFIQFYSQLLPEIQIKIESDFQDIYGLSPTAGFLNLLDEAKKQDINIPKKLEDMNNYDKSIWFFLNHNKIFNQAQAWYEAEETTGWKEVFVNIKDYSEIMDKETHLSKQISNYLYKKEMRGKICEVECYQKDNRIFYVAYPKDYVKLDIGYDDNQKLNKKMPNQSVLKIYFLYYPELGLLSTKAKGGWQKIFVETVLNDSVDSITTYIYDLNKLKDPSFMFPTEPEDKVEYVKVKTVRFSYFRQFPKAYRRVTLDLEIERIRKDGIMEIQDFIKESYLPIDMLNVTYAIIKFQFKSPQKGVRGSVTVQITCPNTINLKDKPLHRKVKNYLVKWGIYRDEKEANEETA